MQAAQCLAPGLDGPFILLGQGCLRNSPERGAQYLLRPLDDAIAQGFLGSDGVPAVPNSQSQLLNAFDLGKEPARRRALCLRSLKPSLPFSQRERLWTDQRELIPPAPGRSMPPDPAGPGPCRFCASWPAGPYSRPSTGLSVPRRAGKRRRRQGWQGLFASIGERGRRDRRLDSVRGDRRRRQGSPVCRTRLLHRVPGQFGGLAEGVQFCSRMEHPAAAVRQQRQRSDRRQGA